MKNFLKKCSELKVLSIFYVSASNYTCFDGYICYSLYGKSIRGSTNSVAIACSNDPNCTAFRYNPKEKVGFLCTNFDAFHVRRIRLYDEDEWKLCEFGSGKSI